MVGAIFIDILAAEEGHVAVSVADGIGQSVIIDIWNPGASPVVLVIPVTKFKRTQHKLRVAFQLPFT